MPWTRLRWRRRWCSSRSVRQSPAGCRAQDTCTAADHRDRRLRTGGRAAYRRPRVCGLEDRRRRGSASIDDRRLGQASHARRALGTETDLGRSNRHRFTPGPGTCCTLLRIPCAPCGPRPISPGAEQDLPSRRVPVARQASRRSLHHARHPPGGFRVLAAEFGGLALIRSLTLPDCCCCCCRSGPYMSAATSITTMISSATSRPEAHAEFFNRRWPRGAAAVAMGGDSGALALFLLGPTGSFPINSASGLRCLVATYLFFKLYNRLDKRTRVWLYPALQFARSAAFVVIVPISPIGAAAVGAHVVSRWVPYHLYRLGATRWPSAQPALIRLVAFMVLALSFRPFTGTGRISELDRPGAAGLERIRCAARDHVGTQGRHSVWTHCR